MPGFLLRLKADLLHGAMSAGYLLAGLLLLQAPTAGLRYGLLGAVAAVSLVVWLAAGRRYRLVADTPTARIASAHQGYVELVGRSELHPGTPGLGFSSMPPSVWFRYVVHQRRLDGKWARVDGGRSDETFLLVDPSGSCVVDPDGAEVIGSHRRVYYQGDYRHTVEYLLPGETLYALGLLRTEGGASAPLDRSGDVRDLLARWKRNRRSLLSRFDFDGDGELDPAEWEQARRQAERQVAKEHGEIRRQPGVHILRAPADGRPYLLSNRDPDRLMRRFRWWSWFHLAVFMAAAATALAGLARLG
ncbi:MAG: hypothetical protein PHF72_02695 [Gammaproteobacteria bacterium]|nr:hypothetical protein [Gammaproteobacteria bacterium]